MKILGLEFNMTGGACPQQYDVLLDGKKVGYVRLRHGVVTAESTSDARMVYVAETIGDGSFDESEQMEHLTKIAQALNESFGTSRQLINMSHLEDLLRGNTIEICNMTIALEEPDLRDVEEMVAALIQDIKTDSTREKYE